uniref:Uncharacterized protein n=1 Tax=Myoviridae sp. ctMne5 TaxID=2825089 RepID=A0A8S5TZU4_9CAUD|nr:MAG TPA: hypothetical protein [Myoviridae sp. ctMne5]
MRHFFLFSALFYLISHLLIISFPFIMLNCLYHSTPFSFCQVC